MKKGEQAIWTRGLRKEFRRLARNPGIGGLIASMFGRAERQTTVALKGLDLRVPAGERVAFIGPNGSGKSTTIKMLTGILHPSGGDARVLGFSPWRQRRELAFHLGSVFGQKSQLWFHLPPMETFYLLSKIYELERDVYQARLEELVEVFAISSYLNTPVRKLSLGERMRCEVVASLLHRPSLLLLDEPTIGLDVVARGMLREHIRGTNQREGTTIFITSHDAGDVESLAERVVVIAEGEAIFDGSVDELRRRFLRTRRLEARLAEPLQIDIRKAIPPDAPWSVVESDEFSILLDIDADRPGATREAIAFLTDRVAIEDLTIAEAPLEQVIREIYHRDRKSHHPPPRSSR